MFTFHIKYYFPIKTLKRDLQNSQAKHVRYSENPSFFNVHPNATSEKTPYDNQGKKEKK